MRSFTLAALLAFALTTVPVAAGQGYENKPDPGIANGSKQRALDAARKQWKREGVRSYAYMIGVSCFCPPMNDVRIVVRKGRPSGAVREGLEDQATVPRLFRTIQKAIDGGAAKLDVTYGKRGVPTKVYIDRDRRIADEEVGYTIRGFAPLKR